ncbi:hypothetical protein H9P43_009628 [Blastocladiella emersonii ATCC 22665]|nr:hypothetical protein H9P43_009628 [Blastocladiella emersonii ATCC 22665]
MSIQAQSWEPGPEVPRLVANARLAQAPVSGTDSDDGGAIDASTLRGVFPYPAANLDSIPVYSLCHVSLRADEGHGELGSRTGSPSAGSPPLVARCPLVVRTVNQNPVPLDAYPPAISGKAASRDLVTTGKYHLEVQRCATTQCGELDGSLRAASRTLARYPALVDQVPRMASIAASRELCIMRKCPQAYLAFTAGTCVPLSHPELRRRGASLPFAPPGTRPQLETLLNADRTGLETAAVAGNGTAGAPTPPNLPQGIGVCLLSAPLRSPCDAGVVDPATGNVRAGLAASALGYAPGDAKHDALPDDMPVSAFVAGGIQFVSTWGASGPLLQNVPRAAADTASIYSLTSCRPRRTTGNSTALGNWTVAALLPGDSKCTSTADCAFSACASSSAGLCATNLLSKSPLTVSPETYAAAVQAAEAREFRVALVTMALMFPVACLLTYASMVGTEKAVRWLKVRRRAARDREGRGKRGGGTKAAVASPECFRDIEAAGQRCAHCQDVHAAPAPVTLLYEPPPASITGPIVVAPAPGVGAKKPHHRPAHAAAASVTSSSASTAPTVALSRSDSTCSAADDGPAFFLQQQQQLLALYGNNNARSPSYTPSHDAVSVTSSSTAATRFPPPPGASPLVPGTQTPALPPLGKKPVIPPRSGSTLARFTPAGVVHAAGPPPMAMAMATTAASAATRPVLDERAR